jgi:hypothetical protein
MAARKRIQITIETDQVLLIQTRGCTARWCPKCACEVIVMDLGQAEVFRTVPQPGSGDREPAKKWHALEDSDGTLHVCLESVLKVIELRSAKRLDKVGAENPKEGSRFLGGGS